MQYQFDFNKKLLEQNVVSQSAVSLVDAKLAKANAKAEMAAAELGFTFIRAPFVGIVDHLKAQQGSLVKKNDVLTTLSDNSVMWVYFNVAEKRYVDYMVHHTLDRKDLKIELVLANGNKFDQPGKIGAVEADFDNSTGVIQIRADFPNPDNLLRNGQTGTVLIGHVKPHAIMIPQRVRLSNLSRSSMFTSSIRMMRSIGREIEIENELGRCLCH